MKIAIRLDDGDKLVSAMLTSGNDELLFISRRGQALRITETSVRPMGRAGRGVTGMKLAQGDEVAAALCVVPEEMMLLLTEKGSGKRVSFEEFSSHGRGTGGQRVYNITEKTGEIIGALNVAEFDEAVCITSQGKSLRVAADSVAKQGRSASGVRVFNIDPPDMVIGLDRVANEEKE